VIKVKTKESKKRGLPLFRDEKSGKIYFVTQVDFQQYMFCGFTTECGSYHMNRLADKTFGSTDDVFEVAKKNRLVPFYGKVDISVEVI
jgi:hypothetical protein